MPTFTVNDSGIGSEVDTGPTTPTCSPPATPQQLPRQKTAVAVNEVFDEVIETHFIYQDAICFVIYKPILGEQAVKGRQKSAKVTYAIKPLWYMAGTPALRDYESKIPSKHKIYLKHDDHAAANDNIYPIRSLQRKRNYLRVILRSDVEYPELKKSEAEYQLHIPPDWAALAHYRLLHHNIDRVLACAEMPAEPGSSPSDDDDETVYIVRWQNEPFAELVPTKFLHKNTYTHYRRHHDVALDFWEDTTISDSRRFRSAASVDFMRQDDIGMHHLDEEFSVRYLHSFKARYQWTNSDGKACKAKVKLDVCWYIGWPVTVSEVELERPDKIDPEKVFDECEVSDPADAVMDRFVDVRVYDKYVRADDNDVRRQSANRLLPIGTQQFKTKTNSVMYDAYVPADWRQLGEKLINEHQLSSAGILCVFKQADLACVHLTNWADYRAERDRCGNTLTSSLTLRKRFSSEMLEFWRKNTFLPKLILAML